jgi:hypothetical protein
MYTDQKAARIFGALLPPAAVVEDWQRRTGDGTRTPATTTAG